MGVNILHCFHTSFGEKGGGENFISGDIDNIVGKNPEVFWEPVCKITKIIHNILKIVCEILKIVYDILKFFCKILKIVCEILKSVCKTLKIVCKNLIYLFLPLEVDFFRLGDADFFRLGVADFFLPPE